jgi:DNA-binding PadR family transcriptional regulator
VTRARSTLTTPDLVVLSLLAEAPRHGYGLNQELERREVRDWAGISRPQVYYSLRKLERIGCIEVCPDQLPGGRGPEARMYRLTSKGKRALADALGAPEWTTQRIPPPFLTWLALASHGHPGDSRRQVKRRREFLERELAREDRTLEAIQQDDGPMSRAAALMVELTIRQLQVELDWLRGVERTLVGPPPLSR